METGIVPRPQIPLNLVLVTERLQLSAGHEEFFRLRLHAVVTEQIAEYLKVPSLIDTRILSGLAEIREGAPLSLLVGNDRRIVGRSSLSIFRRLGIVTGILYLVVVVIIRVRGMLVPVQASSTTFHMILRTIVPSPAATDGGATVDLRRIVLFHDLHPFVTIVHPVSCRLIACCHHHKRRVVTIGVHDTLRLLQKILVDLLSPAQPHPVVRPGGALRLEIEAYFVGCGKGSLRRTIGMETHVIQTILLAFPEDTLPLFLLHGRIASLWETTVLHGAPQEDGTAIDIELSVIDRNVTHAESGLVIVISQRDA